MVRGEVDNRIAGFEAALVSRGAKLVSRSGGEDPGQDLAIEPANSHEGGIDWWVWFSTNLARRYGLDGVGVGDRWIPVSIVYTSYPLPHRERGVVVVWSNARVLAEACGADAEYFRNFVFDDLIRALRTQMPEICNRLATRRRSP